MALVGLTLFVSAALLFSIQLMVGKSLLPIFGGAPAAWNTCLFFFQTMLLLGYLFTHLLVRRFRGGEVGLVYACVLLLAVSSLPLREPGLPTPVVSSPVFMLLGWLTKSIALPFLVLSMMAPLLQHEIMRSRAGENHYRLYAASNLGSLSGLLSYPFLIEPYASLSLQRYGWSVGFVILALLALGSLSTLRSQDGGFAAEVRAGSAGTLRRASRLQWLAQSAIPASLMVSVTNFISTNIAPLPLLWVVPLGLYLTTFVVVFSGSLSRQLNLLSAIWPYLLLLFLPFLVFDLPTEPWLMVVIHLSGFFVGALVCHAMLYEMRPPGAELTAFYLWLAVGGAVGSGINAVVSPLVFSDYWEYPLAMIATLVFLRHRLRILLLGAAGVVFGVLSLLRGELDGDLIFQGRNFFGVKRVFRSADGAYHFLFHGRVIHGVESRIRRECEPLAYFHQTGPVGDLFESLPREGGDRVAIVGLGIGSIACYARSGERYDFYEIDPMVEEIATTPAFFSTLERSKGDVHIVLGDGRLQLEAAPDEHYRVIILDAFNSDAVPTHLLTVEAMRLYLRKLKPDGVLLVNATNTYLNLVPLLAALARETGLSGIVREDVEGGDDLRIRFKYSTRFALLSREELTLDLLRKRHKWSELRDSASIKVWTDDFSNLAALLRFKG